VTSGAPGTLQVVVLPWADVSVDGRGAGTTPIAPVTLPPGPHTVVLRNAELGAARTVQVIIKPGQQTLLRIDLRRTESP
jgi:serine/threonine-protein kinase